MRLIPALLAAIIALGLETSAAEAQTFKWLDERGVVNYSNAPPPGVAAKAAKAQTIDERVSTYEPDPTLKGVARGPSYYEQQLEREWAQRQRLMAMNNAAAAAEAAPCDAPYRGECGDGYGLFGGGYAPVAFARRGRPALHVPPLAHRPVRPHRPGHGQLLLR
jgi:hypothetical protein